MLTKRQKQVLDFVEEFIGGQGYCPSLREIADGLGMSSVATAHQHVVALESKGVLRRPAPNHKRGLEPLSGAGRSGPGVAVLQLAGAIAAGRPIEALEQADEIEIPENLLAGGECFALRVRGESMIEEGIHDGDVIVVRSQQTAENGQTVVALVDGDATLKKFFRSDGTVELRPANRTMAPLFFPADEVEIRGVVISLLRRF